MENVIETRRFYKENDIWYIDLPEFLEANLGTKANLMMVAGADTFLDKLSNNGNEITLSFSNVAFPQYQDSLHQTKLGFDQEYLDEVGHAPVDGGSYYKSLKDSHELWLCPVTKYVFGGYYPKIIFYSVNN